MSKAQTLERILERLATIEARLSAIEARANRPDVVPFFYPLPQPQPWTEPYRITWFGSDFKVT